MMTKKSVTLHFNAGKLKFSAGHFTIFSATERETLHGHNYTLEVQLTAAMNQPGLTFDYRIFEERLILLCKQLHLHCLMPENSPYLKIETEASHYQITFNNETMLLLKKDVVMMPLENISLEALSQWFVDQLAADEEFIAEHQIEKIVLKVFNGPAHAAEAVVRKTA